MPHSLHPVSPGPDFWRRAARVLIDRTAAEGRTGLVSALVLVPTFAHIALLRQALAAELGESFLPPQIRTLDSWLEQQPPDPYAEPPASATERLMALYASLRETGWLKKLFAARRNTDLLPLAQTLVGLADELTAALLPVALAQPEQVEDRWQAALAQLSPRAAALLSDEAQLVWKLWQIERDERDPGMARHVALQRTAADAAFPMFWCSPWRPDALEAAFLDAWSVHQPVELLQLDWSAVTLPAAYAAYAASWPELLDGEPSDGAPAALPAGIVLHEAVSMEDEAQMAAQTIVDWIAAGRQRIAVIPQDRVVARRLRALLERAQVVVSDETGWKLSTTRAAAVLHAWIELASSGGDVGRLFDFLKSPFVGHAALDDPAQRSAMEAALVAAGPAAGWDALGSALSAQVPAKALLDAVAREATRYRAARPVCDWVEDTVAVFAALGCGEALAADKAGAQVLEMLDRLARECERLDQRFSLSEWRVLVDLQMEQTVFVAARADRRVMMVPLNGSILREFDAAIVVGADAEHLPSRPAELLFFADAVRRELGLETRESRQRQQLREFASLLCGCPEVVLSWQARRDGDAVKPCAWIQRLELTLESAGLGRIPRRRPTLPAERLTALPQRMPSPAAPALLPQRLSASGYNSLVACPYQFFASRMLALSAPDEIAELPERRDYGDWLHQILKRYHDALGEQCTPPAQRHALMVAISDELFDAVIARNPGALGFKMRWLSRCDAYVDWANDHEAAGWTFAFGEKWKERLLQHGSVSMQLVGQLDRVDRNADGELMVIDYKTTRVASLKSRLKEREDHQLPFYALLLDPAPVRATYVAIDDDPAAKLEPDDLDEWREALDLQIGDNLSAIAQGGALPAYGSGKSCEWCKMRGLCRKGAW